MARAKKNQEEKPLPQGFRKRKTGGLEYRFTFEGKQYSVYGKNQRECLSKVEQKKAQVKAGRPQRIADKTMEQYLETWLQNRERAVSGATMRIYRKHIKRICKQDIGGYLFGSLVLSELQTQDIRELQRAMIGSGNASRTVNDSLSLLKKALEAAVNERIIDWNPARGIEPLKRTEPQARDTIHRALTPEEVKTFLDAARESHYYNLYRFLLYTGLRIGEAGALTRADLVKDQIRVYKTVTRTETGYTIAEQTKTEAGKRIIPQLPEVKKAIQDQKMQNALLFGSNVLELEEPVFCRPQGGIIRSDKINQDIKAICKKAGIVYFSVHAFRATFTSRCVESGMDTRSLMEILGHVDVQMTLGLYAHSRDDLKREQLQAVSF